jgi:NADH-quinone oxidoreductase subunit M
MMLAVLLRKGVFPLHWWTLDAFDQLRLPALGLLLNSHLGGYLLIRFVIPEFPALSAQWLPNLSYLALGTSVLMAIAGLAEARPRRLLGLLWLSQSAFVLAGLATKTEEGITGSLVHWWVVSMATTGMISVYRSVEARTTSAGRAGGFQGLGAHAPRLAVYFAVRGLALVGLPGTLGFVAEDLLFHGALKAHPLLGVALPLATALNAITVLRLFSSIFLGRRAIHVPPIPDALPAERLAFTALIVLLVAGGLMPAVLIALRTPAAAGLARLLAGS